MDEKALKRAIKTFELQKRTAEAFAAHGRDCRICGSKLLSFFVVCNEGRRLEFEYRTAKAEADAQRDLLRIMQAQTPPSPASTKAPTVKWCEDLFRLRDDRTE